jgi:hypothetical protein
LKDLQVADEERHFEKTQKKVLERFFCNLMILFWTAELENFYENAEKEPSTNHDENEHHKTDVDEIKILREKINKKIVASKSVSKTYHCVVCVGVRKPPN